MTALSIQTMQQEKLALAPSVFNQHKTAQTLTTESLHPKVEALNFRRLKFKNTQPNESEYTENEWDIAELEYRRFLHLKVHYPSVSLVPSKSVDDIWHQHILDTRAYREDCENLFGYFLDHYPYFGIYGKDDYAKLQSKLITNRLITIAGICVILIQIKFTPC